MLRCGVFWRWHLKYVRSYGFVLKSFGEKNLMVWKIIGPIERLIFRPIYSNCRGTVPQLLSMAKFLFHRLAKVDLSFDDFSLGHQRQFSQDVSPNPWFFSESVFVFFR